MSRISKLPLAESARRGLDRELENARGTTERLQVLRRWFTALGLTEAIIAGRDVRAEARAAALLDAWRPHSTLPGLGPAALSAP